MTAGPSTPSDADDHLTALDGWRGLAIGLLLVGHFMPVPGLNFGALGVNFFFVLSGWLMTRLLFVQRTPIDVFYRRRIARIVPAHLTFITIIALVWLFAGRPFSTGETLAAALFVNNYVGAQPGSALMPFGHIWSLSVEEHSYVLLSFIAIAARRGWVDERVGVGALALICAACAVAYPSLHRGPHFQFEQWLHTEVQAYGIFVSGFIFLTIQRLGPARSAPFAVPLLALMGAALHWWSVPRPVQQVLGVGALALAVNLLPQAPALLRGAMSWSPLRQLGLWSFSLYVWQQPFYRWSRYGGVPTWMGLLLTFAVGLTSYYVLEQPARRFLNRHWGSRSSTSRNPRNKADPA